MEQICMDGWTTRELVLLTELVKRHGLSSWTQVSKQLKSCSQITLRGTYQKVVESSLEPFQPKKCHQQYQLLQQHQTKRKRSSSSSTQAVEIAEKVRKARIKKLVQSIEEKEKCLRALKKEILDIEAGAVDEELNLNFQKQENSQNERLSPKPKPKSHPQNQIQNSTAPQLVSPGFLDSTEIVGPKVPRTLTPNFGSDIAIVGTELRIANHPNNLRYVQYRTPIDGKFDSPSPVIPEHFSKPEYSPTYNGYLFPSNPMQLRTGYLPTPKPYPSPEYPPNHERTYPQHQTSNTEENPKGAPIVSSMIFDEVSRSPGSPQDEETQNENDVVETFISKDLESYVRTPPVKTQQKRDIRAVSEESDNKPGLYPSEDSIRESSEFARESNEPPRKRRKTKPSMDVKELKPLLLKIWKALSIHRFAAVFKNPVKYNEAPDYDDIIKRRMDLTTLKDRIAREEIKTKTEFWHDLLLMFQNAMIYNPKGSDIYRMAEALKDLSQQKMKEILEDETKKSNHKENKKGISTRARWKK